MLLPQLANVDDSVAALGSANWWWLAGAVAMSAFTYVAAAIGMIGGVREPLPFVPTLQVSLASSFVNRVTPANVGGMALNVRYMQKAGIPPAEAVTGVGLNVVGRRHRPRRAAVRLLRLGQPGRRRRVLGARRQQAARRHPGRARRRRDRPRHPARTQVRARAASCRRCASRCRSIASVARSPVRLAALFGGSIGVTLAYITALACTLAAFDGGLSYAEVGAVYLGASLIAAAAPTPGGLGALEAALVAGLHRRRRRALDRRRRRAELPPAHVLAADPPRLALLPPPRPPQLHLTELTM